jgi:CHRD domain
VRLKRAAFMKRKATDVNTSAVVLPLLTCVLFTVSISGQAELRYKARLSTVPVDFVTAPNVSGSGSATAIVSGSRLSISGTFEGLGSPATVARVHKGPLAIRGPVVFELMVTKATEGTISGSFELKPNQIEDLKQRRLYIQLHSEKAADGNLWGWLLPEERSK